MASDSRTSKATGCVATHHRCLTQQLSAATPRMRSNLEREEPQAAAMSSSTLHERQT